MAAECRWFCVEPTLPLRPFSPLRRIGLEVAVCALVVAIASEVVE